LFRHHPTQHLSNRLINGVTPSVGCNELLLSFNARHAQSMFHAQYTAEAFLVNEFENIAKKVQEFASTRRQVDDIPDLVLKLEKVCNQACMELENEFKRIKGTTR